MTGFSQNLYKSSLWPKKKKKKRERKKSKVKTNTEKKVATHITGKWLIFLIYKEFLEARWGGNQVLDRKIFIFSQFTGREKISLLHKRYSA